MINIPVWLKPYVLFAARAFLALPFLACTAYGSVKETPLLEDAVVSVAETAGKPVVSISSEHTEGFKRRSGEYFNAPLDEDPFGEYNYFLRRFFEEESQPQIKRLGLGSGIIISADGKILTNAHVVEGADRITVTLYDGREFSAEIKGIDRRSDLAVIKISASRLPVARLGDSSNLKIGQWIVAIGNPFGYAVENPEPAVTAGVVSALHRSFKHEMFGDRDFADLIQTDAAINPGSSGGPLVNLKGEVIGVNVAIFSTSGGYQGMGFAIPANNAKRVVDRLAAGKKVSYGWLGVVVQDLDEPLAKYFGLADPAGALVIRATAAGPAEKAGIKERDIIRSVDGKPVNNVSGLLSAVGKIEPGRKVKVVVVREKKLLLLDAVITERPEDARQAAASSNAGAAALEPAPEKWRGIIAGNLTPEAARRLGSAQDRGVVITEVVTASPADEAGLVPGDVIAEINKTQVADMAGYKKMAGSAKGECLIRTQRGYFLLKE